MTRQRIVFAAVVFAVCFGQFALGYVLATEERPIDPKLTDYCHTVSAALATDARALESDDPSRRLAAADRFGGFTTYHSEPEIRLCSKAPPDLAARDSCWIARDFACLAKLARNASEATKP